MYLIPHWHSKHSLNFKSLELSKDNLSKTGKCVSLTWLGKPAMKTSIKNIWDHWFYKSPWVSFSRPHPFDFLCTQLCFLLLLMGFYCSLNGVDSGFWRLILAHHYSDFLHSSPSSKFLVSFFIKPPWDRSLLP